MTYFVFVLFLLQRILYISTLLVSFGTRLLFMIALCYFAKFPITSEKTQKELKMTIACLLCVVKN